MTPAQTWIGPTVDACGHHQQRGRLEKAMSYLIDGSPSVNPDPLAPGFAFYVLAEPMALRAADPSANFLRAATAQSIT